MRGQTDEGTAPAVPSGFCGQPMRGGETCNMDAGHRGRHSSIAWQCDGCGKMRRGTPAVRHPEAGDYCFVCIVIDASHWPHSQDYV